MGVNGAGLHLLIVAPDLESDLIARDRLAHLPEKELGTLEFFFRKSNGSSVSLRQGATIAIGGEPDFSNRVVSLKLRPTPAPHGRGKPSL